MPNLHRPVIGLWGRDRAGAGFIPGFADGLRPGDDDSVIEKIVARMKRSAIRERTLTAAPDFAEFIIGRAFARPVGFIRATCANPRESSRRLFRRSSRWACWYCRR